MKPASPSVRKATAAELDALSPAQIARLAEAVIGLAADGRVLSCGGAASALLGLPPDAVIGRHYFTDVAPGTNVPAFHGRFLDCVREGQPEARFAFVFGQKPHPISAMVDIRRSTLGDRWWLVITPLAQLGVGARREAVLDAVAQRARAEPVDPGLCEREPIHIPGSIQPNAVMIAADAESFSILAYSANVGEVLPEGDAAIDGHAIDDKSLDGKWLDGKPLDGKPLDAVLPAEFVAMLRAEAGSGGLREGRLVARMMRLPARDGARFYALAHIHLDRLIVELELTGSRPEDFSAASPLELQRAMARLRAATTVNAAASDAAREIRGLTGFESVLVYRFDAEWNGEAIAEDSVAAWNRPLIGLRFPASDIPAQARALYHKAKSRFVIDRDCVPVPLVAGQEAGNAPVDLTFAQNRTLSPIHLEYQRNLGVDGSMSISILVEDRLWGLMIGHHRRPHYVAPETRAAATALTDAFAMRVQEIEARHRWAEQQAHLATEVTLIRGLTRRDDFVEALTRGPTSLLDLFGAGGAAIVSGGSVAPIGRCPDEAALRILAAWLRRELPPDRNLFATTSLASAFAPAAAYAEVASGLLAAFVDAARTHLLLWFKPEVPSTVTWSGDPRKPVLPGAGEVAVLPRRSFERWVEQRSGFSTDWPGWQGAIAEQLAQAVEGVVLRQRRKIAELTGLVAEKERLLEQKDLLRKEIDHRVKNSLQIVSAFLQLQRKQVDDPDARQAFADSAARVMSVARVHDSLYQTESPEQVDLGQTIAALCADLASMAGSDYRIDLDAPSGLMVPYQKAVALSLIATELVTNAFKYAVGPNGEASVAVRVAADGSGVRLAVCDDGEGLPEGWERKKASGTGLGMKLIRAMLDQIDARMEVANAPGACFTVHA